MANSKFLFVTLDALTVDLAWTLVKEGHEVKFYTKEKNERDIGQGFIPLVGNWKKHLKWADVVVFDDTLGMGPISERLRKDGKAVVGGTRYSDRLEDDRGFGQEELKRHGINILKYENFTDFDEAIAYVKKYPDAYVIKPSGEAQNIKRLLFVGREEDGSDVVRVLEAYKRVWSDTIKVFQLQKRVSGVEVAVGAFFNGRQFVNPVNINFEHKKLFPGELGPPTGEMGTSTFWSSPNKLFNSTLKKMEPTLAAESYVGYIDLNCIANAYGIYPLEFTARFGYPTILIQQESMRTPAGEFLTGLAHGTLTEFKVKSGYHIGVRILVPPYPFKDKRTFDAYSKNATIVFKKNQSTNVLSSVHLEGVKLINGEWLVTGTSGRVLTVVGSGPTMAQAKQQAYHRIENILIPGMYYRTDISDRWGEDSDRLHTWGYLREQ